MPLPLRLLQYLTTQERAEVKKAEREGMVTQKVKARAAGAAPEAAAGSAACSDS